MSSSNDSMALGLCPRDRIWETGHVGGLRYPHKVSGLASRLVRVAVGILPWVAVRTRARPGALDPQ